MAKKVAKRSASKKKAKKKTPARKSPLRSAENVRWLIGTKPEVKEWLEDHAASMYLSRNQLVVMVLQMYMEQTQAIEEAGPLFPALEAAIEQAMTNASKEHPVLNRRRVAGSKSGA